MNEPTAAQKRIAEIYAQVEKANPEKSYAWTVARTCWDYTEETGIGIDVNHVVDAYETMREWEARRK